MTLENYSIKMGKNKITYKKSTIGNYYEFSNTDFLETIIKSKKFIFGLSGRTLIFEVFKALNIPKGSKILVPEFYPHGIKLPLERMGMKIINYKLDEKFSPLISNIESLVEKHNIKVAFFIHYFGNSINLDSIMPICDNKKIFVLEDCAQALSIYQEKNYKYNSIILYSFTKFLSISDGAMAVFNIDESKFNLNKNPHNKKDLFLGHISVFFNKISLHIRKFQTSVNNNLIYNISGKISSFFYILYYAVLCLIKSSVPISKNSFEYLHHFNYKVFSEKRKNNYNIISNHINFESVDKISNIEHNMLGLVLKTSSISRDMIRKFLRKNNIDVLIYKHAWFTTKQDCKVQSNKLKTFFILPINEHLSETDMLYVADVINKIIKLYGVKFIRL